MNIIRIFTNRRHIFQNKIRFFSSKEPRKNKNNITARYSESEQQLILNVFNNNSETIFERLKLQSKSVKCVEEFIRKNNQFTDINQILELRGIGPCSFEKICTAILTKEEPSNKVATLAKRSQNQFKATTYLYPGITEDQIKQIKTVVGVEIGFSAITWTKLDYEKKNIEWGLENYIDNVDLKFVINVYNTVLNIRERIPEADIYIMEGTNWGDIRNSQTSLIRVVTAAQTAAMLISLLNHNINTKDNHQHVYLLKKYLSTRYFRTLIGSEKVSSQTMVESMFENNFPEFCTNVSFNQDSIDLYLRQDKSFKEKICNSLLLTLTFMELILKGKHIPLKPRVK